MSAAYGHSRAERRRLAPGQLLGQVFPGLMRKPFSVHVMLFRMLRLLPLTSPEWEETVGDGHVFVFILKYTLFAKYPAATV